METSVKAIEVTGDVTIDWMIISPRGLNDEIIEFTEMWGAGLSCRAVSQPGGAALQTDILKAIVKAKAGTKPGLKSEKAEEQVAIEVSGPSVSKKNMASPGYEGAERTYISWSLFPREKGDSQDNVWRISKFWGEDPATVKAPAPVPEEPQGETPDLLVVEDLNLGFRNNRAMWQSVLSDARKPRAIIVKMFSPLGAGLLWSELMERHSELVTVVVALSDLRKSGAHVGNSLSWEQIYSEILASVKKSRLSLAARVIVLLGPAGAAVIERGGYSCLVFDRYNQEGDWEKERPGLVVGYTSCMVASLAWEIVTSRSPDIIWATKRGVNACRVLHSDGYEQYGSGSGFRLRFPCGRIAGAILMREDEPANAPQKHEGKAEFAVERKFKGVGTPASILAANVKGDYDDVALEVAVNGPEEKLPSVPIEEIGHWSSVDRGEIESMRSIQNILSEYVAQYVHGRRLERPLSIAVFGPPGSGKSFAIKQMARALFPDELARIEFNLSQLESDEDLDKAFQEVRDLTLEQLLPLVFWDEFDSPVEGRELGWLRFFLAPMQDGEFREAGVSRPVGPAIFVFAGGTCSTIEEFKRTIDDRSERHAKKKDFISRLKGYVNILGPNPMKEKDDKLYPLRRALLLRAILKGKAAQLFVNGELQIDPGVLRALITIDEFLHGARSVEAIIDMSAITGKLRFERSCLPATNQLELHVNARKFLDIVDSQEQKGFGN